MSTYSPETPGVYGQDALQAPEQVAADLQAQGAQAAAADVDALRKQLEDLAAHLSAVQAAALAAGVTSTPKAPTLREAILASSLDSQTAHLFSIVADLLGESAV